MDVTGPGPPGYVMVLSPCRKLEILRASRVLGHRTCTRYWRSPRRLRRCAPPDTVALNCRRPRRPAGCGLRTTRPFGSSTTGGLAPPRSAFAGVSAELRRRRGLLPSRGVTLDPCFSGRYGEGRGRPPPPAPGTPPKAIQEATLSGRAVKPDPFSQGDTSRGSPAPSRRPRSAARAAARPRGFKRSTPLSAPACCRGRVVGAEGGDHYCVHCVPPRRSPHPPQRPLPGRARAEALAPPGVKTVRSPWELESLR